MAQVDRPLVHYKLIQVDHGPPAENRALRRPNRRVGEKRIRAAPHVGGQILNIRITYASALSGRNLVYPLNRGAPRVDELAFVFGPDLRTSSPDKLPEIAKGRRSQKISVFDIRHRSIFGRVRDRPIGN